MWPYGSSEMGQRIQQFEWASTALGAIETWCASLRGAVQVMLDTDVPMTIQYGPDALLLYNDAWIRLLGERHPSALGQPSPPPHQVLTKSPLRSDTGDVIGQISLLAASDQHRALFQSIDEGYFVADVIYDDGGRPIDLYCLDANPAATEHLGRSFVGKRLLDIDVRYESFWYEVPGRVARTGKSERLECYAALHEHWYEMFVFKIDGRGDNRVGLVMRAIDDRKRRERNLRFLDAVDADFARLSMPDEIMDAIGSKLASHLCLYTCTFCDVDDARGEITVAYGWNRDAKVLRRDTYTLADYWIPEFSTASQAGTTTVINDLQSDRRADAQAYAALNLGSMITVPFHQDGVWTRLLAVTDSQPRIWRADEVALVQELSSRLFPRLERARAYAELREREAALSASEARYRSLFESMDEGFCIVQMILDADGKPIDYRHLETNPAFVRQTGLVDALGRTLRELVQPVEPQWLDVFGNVARAGVPTRFVKQAMGLRRWFDVYAFRIGDAGECKVAVLFKDITERVDAEVALRDAGQRDAFRVRLGDALRPLTEQGEIREVTARILGEHLGASRVHYSAVNGDEIVIDREYTTTARHMAGTHFARDGSGPILRELRAGRTVVIEDSKRFARPEELAVFETWDLRAMISVPVMEDGDWVYVLSVHSATPRSWRADEVALVQETAERAWGAVKRVNAVQALQDADRRKDEFLAMLAHELRNPLAPLRTGLEVIKLSRQAPEVVDNMRAMMERQVEHMVRLIDDLLDVSRITRGKITLQKKPTLVSELVEVAVEANRAGIEERGIELHVDVMAETARVDVDPTRMVQVLSNVLHNARKFTPHGGRIDLSARTQGSELILSVRDTGIGISAAALRQIFDLFSQGDRSDAQVQGGLGIGLALARQLVEMHGGRIDASSAGPGRGSEFVIRLPVVAELPASQELVIEPLHALGPPVHSVVIIDDNDDAATTIAMLVRALGGTPYVAHDGVSGIECVRRVHPEVVLLDIGMPGLDGYETCRRIRESVGKDVAIIAVTGYGRKEDKDRALAAGFDAHMTKPPDPKLLRSFLHL